MKHTSIVNDIKKLQKIDKPQVGQALDIFGTSSFGMVLFILAVIVIIPTGIIPGIAVATSFFISFIVLQYLFGRQTIAVPHKVRNIHISQKIIDPVAAYVIKYEKHIEKIFVAGRKHTVLAQPYKTITSFLLLTVTLSMIPLTLLPFIEVVPGALVAIYGLALLFADGKIMVVNWGLSIIYLVSLVWFSSEIARLIM